MVGADVCITVLGIQGNQVRIGVNAPKQVPVHRQEIYERIKATQCADLEGAMSPTFSSATVHR